MPRPPQPAPELTPELRRKVRALFAARRRAADLERRTRELILELHAAGVPAPRIADMLGLSRNYPGRVIKEAGA